MPHVIVKLYAGRSEKQKASIAEKITKAVIAGAECAEQSVSVSIEDIEPDEWAEKVYKPDIMANWDKLYKKPGYSPV
jgi:4-oxalocrotonate tautomerase